MQVINEEIAHLVNRKGNFTPIGNLILSQAPQIESWLKEEWKKTPPPLMSSVDLRNAGFKLSPVDTNLFPAGFNNISQDSLSLCYKAAQLTLNTLYPQVKRILLLPENHTRNAFYFKSLNRLYHILTQTGYEVRIGSLDEEVIHPKKIEVDENKTLLLEPLIRDGDKVKVINFEPDLIVLNNDLSSGIPHILLGIKQDITPALKLGWSSRLKSTHFRFYEEITTELAKLLDIDPWFINPYFSKVDEIDFMSQTGLEELITQTQEILDKIKKKYEEYQIKETPYVAIKADNGTYGMSVMTLSNIDILKTLNRKQRTRMAAIKGGKKVDHVIIQEGVYTFESKSETTIVEPVIYMIGSFVVGGFYRMHENKGINENLNAPGMYFEPIHMIQESHVNFENNLKNLSSLDKNHARLYVYSVVGRLAALAAAREMAEIK